MHTNHTKRFIKMVDFLMCNNELSFNATVPAVFVSLVVLLTPFHVYFYDILFWANKSSNLGFLFFSCDPSATNEQHYPAWTRSLTFQHPVLSLFTPSFPKLLSLLPKWLPIIDSTSAQYTVLHSCLWSVTQSVYCHRDMTSVIPVRINWTSVRRLTVTIHLGCTVP